MDGNTELQLYRHLYTLQKTMDILLHATAEEILKAHK